ncbi:hypothetical protein L915_00084, partial [Phytophthora nicotianae]
ANIETAISLVASNCELPLVERAVLHYSPTTDGIQSWIHQFNDVFFTSFV